MSLLDQPLNFRDVRVMSAYPPDHDQIADVSALRFRTNSGSRLHSLNHLVGGCK